MVIIAPLVVALSFLAQFSVLAVPVPLNQGVAEVSIYTRSSQGGRQNPRATALNPNDISHPLVVQKVAGMKRKRSKEDVGGREVVFSAPPRRRNSNKCDVQ